jgi:hypothetical protein
MLPSRSGSRVGHVELFTVSGEQGIQSAAAEAGKAGDGTGKEARGCAWKHILPRFVQEGGIVSDLDLCFQAVPSSELVKGLAGEGKKVPRRIPAEK